MIYDTSLTIMADENEELQKLSAQLIINVLIMNDVNFIFNYLYQLFNTKI